MHPGFTPWGFHAALKSVPGIADSMAVKVVSWSEILFSCVITSCGRICMMTRWKCGTRWCSTQPGKFSRFHVITRIVSVVCADAGMQMRSRREKIFGFIEGIRFGRVLRRCVFCMSTKWTTGPSP